jgi:predicted HicB family RNase H-like nuclease
MGKFSDLKPSKKSIESFIDDAENYQNRNSIEQQKEPVERLNVEIPKSLHKTVKIKAAADEVKIRDIVINALNEYLKK